MALLFCYNGDCSLRGFGRSLRYFGRLSRHKTSRFANYAFVKKGNFLLTLAALQWQQP
jgi:hypothetical protein